jgi:hypothetical protein
MPAMLRWPRLALALVVCVAALGCAGGAGQDGGDDPALQADGARESAERQSNGAPGAPGDRANDGAPGAPGAPGDRDNDSQAKGAPIKIPEVTISQGLDVDLVRKEIELGIRAQCEGELCVTLKVEQRDPSFESCQFVTTDPAPNTQVERETTVVLVVGTQPCTPDPSSDTGDQGSNGTEPSDQTGPTDDSQPPPDDTGASEDTQPPDTS